MTRFARCRSLAAICLVSAVIGVSGPMGAAGSSAPSDRADLAAAYVKALSEENLEHVLGTLDRDNYRYEYRLFSSYTERRSFGYDEERLALGRLFDRAAIEDLVADKPRMDTGGSVSVGFTFKVRQGYDKEGSLAEGLYALRGRFIFTFGRNPDGRLAIRSVHEEVGRPTGRNVQASFGFVKLLYSGALQVRRDVRETASGQLETRAVTERYYDAKSDKLLFSTTLTEVYDRRGSPNEPVPKATSVDVRDRSGRRIANYVSF